MVTDRQVKMLKKLIESKDTQATAVKAGMGEKTAPNYCRLKKLPGEIRVVHAQRIRQDPLTKVREEIKGKLLLNPLVEAKTLSEDLQYR